MQYVAVIFPTVGVAAIFYVAMRAIILADRRERAQIAKLEEKERDDADANFRDQQSLR